VTHRAVVPQAQSPSDDQAAGAGGGKWLELLEEIAPRVTRVAVLRDPDLSSGTGQFGVIQSVAPPTRLLRRLARVIQIKPS
jgi:hypothetical protein